MTLVPSACILFGVISAAICGNKIEPIVNRKMHACVQPTTEKLISETKSASNCNFVRTQCSDIAFSFHCSEDQQTGQTDAKTKLALPDCVTKDSSIVNRMLEQVCPKSGQPQARKPAFEPTEAGKFVTEVGTAMLKNLPQIDLDDFAQFLVDKAKETSKESKCKDLFPPFHQLNGAYRIMANGFACVKHPGMDDEKVVAPADAWSMAAAYSAKLKAPTYSMANLIMKIWHSVCSFPSCGDFKEFSKLEASIREAVAKVSNEPLKSM